MPDIVAPDPVRPCSACGQAITAREYRLLLVGQGALGNAVYFFVHYGCRDSAVLPVPLRVVGAGYLT